MNFTSPLIRATLQRRYKRFLADVTLEDGSTVVAHCPNTGAMTGCADSGNTVWLRHSDDPKRKLAYTWELSVTQQGHWIGINTHNANHIVAEALATSQLTPLGHYAHHRREVPFGKERSRVDFLLTDDAKPDCYVEVKSVTLLQDGQGYFPDAKTSRGTKHLRELTDRVHEGHRAVLMFCVQHTGIHSVAVARHIDADYADALNEARHAGVEIFALGCQIDEKKIEANQLLPLEL